MPLSYIISRVADKMGMNPSVSTQRSTLLYFINSAAKEIYNTSDMAGVLDELELKINADQTIALPDYVGQIRAMRESYSHLAVGLSQMRPHYNQYNWTDSWRNWRLKGVQPLQQSIHNQSALVFTVKAVETTPVVVTITGSVEGASSVSETITMDATSKQTTNAFLTVTSIKKSSVSAYDVIISDIDGNQLSYIANNKLAAGFQIVDISSAPWFPPNSDVQLGWVEVLYKRALPTLSNDGDEFPAVGYDDVIVNKCLQLWYEEQNNLQSAVAYQEKATMLLAQIHEDANRGTADCVALVENPHDKIMPRTGYGKDWRYSYRITGR